MMRSGQTSLSIDFAASYGVADYYVGDANAQAFEAATKGGEKLVFLRGDKATGKTHLAHVFCETYQASLLSDADLQQATVTSSVVGDFAVDDADNLSPTAEENLFHLYNRAASNRRILLTSALPPQDIIKQQSAEGRGLGDWQSRLMSFPLTEIIASPPDEAFLISFLQKNFHDRQIYPKSAELQYILKYAERDFASLCALIELLHRHMLERQVKLSKQLIGACLQKNCD